MLKSQSKNFRDAVNQSNADEESDLFIGYATIDNYVSLIYRNGSKFIQELCSIIENEENIEIDFIIRAINRRLSVSDKQVANVDHSLRKLFYFKTSKSSATPINEFNSKDENIADGNRAFKNGKNIEIWEY